VRVDEAWSERQSAAVDDLIVGSRRQRPNIGDAIAGDTHARFARGASRAVEE